MDAGVSSLVQSWEGSGGVVGGDEHREAWSSRLQLASPHSSLAPAQGPTPLTGRDPWLRGQGTPLLALAELYQILEAQHGAYAGSVPRVELGEE